MKNPFSGWFGRSKEQPLTGAIFHPVRVNPGDAQLMQEMTDFSGKLAKSMASQNEKMLRSLDAASAPLEWDNSFKSIYGTGDTEIFTWYYRIWARARGLACNTPHGKAIVRTHQSNQVGHKPFDLTMRIGKFVNQPHPKTGIQVKVFVPETETSQMIEKGWHRYIRHDMFCVNRTTSFMEAMNQLVAEAVTVGGVLIRLWDGYDNKFGFAVEMLEVDRLQPNFNGTAPESGNPIYGSIEFHKFYKYPVAYWVMTTHPGAFNGTRIMAGTNSSGLQTRISNGDVLRERIPAENIIHYNNLRNRAEQTYGFTEIEACVQKIYENFKYAQALTLASLASTCKPWVIEKNTPTGLTYTPSKKDFEDLMGLAEERGAAGLNAQGLNNNAPQLQQGLSQNREVMSPAMTKVLEWGFTMKVLDPKFPIEAAHEFRQDNNKEIATAAAISYSDMTGDFQSLGYIAAQMSQRPSRDFAMVNQENIIDVVVLRIFERWLKSSITFSVFDLEIKRLEEFVNAARFRGKRFPFTDELREVQALVLKLDAKIITPQQAQDLLPDGKDIEDIIAEWAEWNERLEAYGMPIETDPTQVKEQENVNEPAQAGQGAGDAPATSKPAKAQGSVTAGMQKNTSKAKRTKGQIMESIQRLLDEDNPS